MNEGIARRPARRWPLFVGLAILALTVFVIPVAAKSDGQSDVAGARNATASFHDLDAANAAGYTVRVADVNGITCIDNPGTGAMGVHYLDPGWSPSCSTTLPPRRSTPRRRSCWSSRRARTAMSDWSRSST